MQHDSTPSRSGGANRIGFVCAIVVLAAALFFQEQHALGPVDDAYISLRYAENLSHGAGLRFQSGPAVEGYTNFLLVVLESGALALGLEPPLILALAGLLPWMALAWIFAGFARRRIFGGDGLAAGCFTVGLFVQPAGLVWATSGMETALFAALLFASFVTSLERSRPGWLVGLLFCLAALTRPEALALLPLLAWNLAQRDDSGRAARLAVAVFVAAYGAYSLARFAYFGFWLPNTYHVKMGGSGSGLWQRGWLYVWDFLCAHPLLSLAALAGGCVVRTATEAARSLPWALALLAVIVVEGGDHFTMFRFAVPVLPFLGVLAAVVWARLGTLRFLAARRRLWLAIPLVLFLVNAEISLRSKHRTVDAPMTHIARSKLESQFAREWSELGSWFEQNTPPGTKIGSIVIGAIGYYSERTLLDPYGIIDTHIAHLDSELGAGLAGHEKFDVDHMLGLEADYWVVINLKTPRPVREEELPREVWGAFHSALVAHPRFKSQYRLESPACPGGFWNLSVRRP